MAVPDQESNAGSEVVSRGPTPVQSRARVPRILRQFLVLALYGLAMVALLLGGLKLIDRFVAVRISPVFESANESAALTIRTLELYPFEGFHVQPNFRHRGPMPWEGESSGEDYDVRTGDKGFFIDFSLDNPPPKTADEFRIILVGGSGAQGWGGTRNETMFYAVLERMLNARFGERGVRVRVINLAMGATSAYQNFLSLNLHAHSLEPDLILAYVGRNDFFVSVYHEEGTDVPTLFNELNAFSYASRGNEYPEGMAWLMNFLPNIMRRTSVGLGIKIAFGWPHFERRAREGYVRAAGLRITSLQQVIDDYATPRLVHSLKSVKRDFGGVPMMVAWQPIGQESKLFKGQLDPDFYERMYQRTKSEVAGYMNDGWFFVNFHQIGMMHPDIKFHAHLDDTAHLAVASILADRIEALLPGLLTDRVRRLAAGLPAYGR